jgi:hypothetical protein
MKSVIWILLLVVVAVGCKSNAPPPARLADTDNVVVVDDPTSNPVVRVEGGMALYVFQGGYLRALVDVLKTGDIKVPLLEANDGTGKLYYGTCKRTECGKKIDEAIQAACVICAGFREPCCPNRN